MWNILTIFPGRRLNVQEFEMIAKNEKRRKTKKKGEKQRKKEESSQE